MSGRRIGDQGQRESNEVWKRSQEISSSKVPQVDLYLWKESKWEDADKKVVRPYNRGKKRFCTKEGEGVSVVKRRKRIGAQIHLRTTEERVY